MARAGVIVVVLSVAALATVSMGAGIDLSGRDLAHSDYSGRDPDAGELDVAIRDFTRAIELQPDRAGYFRNRGVAYCSKLEFDCAIQDIGRAIELNPAWAQAYSSDWRRDRTQIEVTDRYRAKKASTVSKFDPDPILALGVVLRSCGGRQGGQKTDYSKQKRSHAIASFVSVDTA